MKLGPHQIAVKELSRKDKNIAIAVKKYGMPDDRVTEGGFDTLLRMIIGQQISVKAANAVWSKMVNANINTTNNILSATDESLKEAGLSRQKISYSKDLAEKINSGLLNLNELKHLSSEATHKKLTQVRGIGDWTANIYQLFVLCDMDAFPQADLAIQEGAKRFFKLESRPSSNDLLKIVEKWVPLRGAAALVLWQIYRVEVHEGSKIS